MHNSMQPLPLEVTSHILMKVLGCKNRLMSANPLTLLKCNKPVEVQQMFLQSAFVFA